MGVSGNIILFLETVQNAINKVLFGPIKAAKKKLYIVTHYYSASSVLARVMDIYSVPPHLG